MSKMLVGCYVISLRPVGRHAALRRAAAGCGARVLALSPWKLQARRGDDARAQLDDALQCDRVLFTSPAAVAAAAALRPLRSRAGQRCFAVGTATADALRRAGVAGAIAPRRMDSEGVLALPEFDAGDAGCVGLVTAPGGRELIEAALRARGVAVVRADVYARVPSAVSARAVGTLAALDMPAWLALSSGAALELVLAQLAKGPRERLLASRVVASSERLAQLARSLGFAHVAVAASARPRDVLAAIVADASASMRGAPPAASPDIP